MNSLSAVTLLLVVACATAQWRSYYAGGGLQYPRPINTNGGDAGDGLGNRGGFDTPTLTNRDQFGHDTRQVEAAGSLPREAQPFWMLNRGQILRHIGINAPAAPATAAAAAPAATPAGTQPAAAVETTSDFSSPSQPSVSTIDSTANLA